MTDSPLANAIAAAKIDMAEAELRVAILEYALEMEEYIDLRRETDNAARAHCPADPG